VKDDELGDLIPILACSDIAAEHDFLVETLGFTSAGLVRQPDGRVVHGEVRAGQQRIWLLGAEDAGIVAQVEDVDAHYARVREAGAEIIYEPRDQDYGRREYGVRDPEGHNWWIGTPTAPPERLDALPVPDEERHGGGRR
jgi:MerR family transcriptional regulator, thiopeptide resistance regulator